MLWTEKRTRKSIRLLRYMGGITLFSLSLTYALILLIEGTSHLEEWVHIATLVPILVAPPIAYVGMSRKIAIEELNIKLQHALSHDQLTQAHTRQALIDIYGQIHSDHVVALIDIDHFKQINDTYGHLVGDEALKALVRSCKSVLRSGDIVSRYGGEEFVLVLRDVTEEEAASVLERLRAELRKIPVVTKDGLLHMTVSIGMTRCAPEEGLESAIARADKAMYRAKDSGRNRICIAPPHRDADVTVPAD